MSDAEVVRPFADGVAALERKKVANDTPDVRVVAHRTNAGTNAERINELVDAAGGVNELIFVNIRVPRDWENPTNAALADAAGRYRHVRVVDWYGESAYCDTIFLTYWYPQNLTASDSLATLIVVYIKS